MWSFIFNFDFNVYKYTNTHKFSSLYLIRTYCCSLYYSSNWINASERTYGRMNVHNRMMCFIDELIQITTSSKKTCKIHIVLCIPLANILVDILFLLYDVSLSSLPTEFFSCLILLQKSSWYDFFCHYLCQGKIITP